MKILYLIYSGLGGHGSVFFSLIDADTEKIFEYEALFYGIENVKTEYKIDCKKRKINWFFAKKKYKIDFGYYTRLFKYINYSKADIVFLNGGEYVWLAKVYSFISKKKCKVVVCETQANHLKTFVQHFWSFCSLLLANKIIFLTQEYKLQIKRKFRLAYKESKISVIPNGINLDIYKPSIEPNSNFFVIGMQSRIVKIKDHSTLLKAFSILKNNKTLQLYNVKLKIAGDGEYINTLTDLAKELNIENDVEFLGRLDENDLIHFLHSLKIYVHASLGETMSTAIMQAMACKLPIIASDVNGINNMIQNEKTGLLIPVQDVISLSDSLTKCITNETLRRNLSLNALKFSQLNYSNKIMLERYKKVFLQEF